MFLVAKTERDWRLPRLRQLEELIGICEFIDDIGELKDDSGILVVTWNRRFVPVMADDEVVIQQAWKHLQGFEVTFVYAEEGK